MRRAARSSFVVRRSSFVCVNGALPLLLVTLAACGRSIAAPATMPPPALAPPYALQVGDVIAIKFYRNPELNDEVTVRPDGKISLQLMDDVQAVGLSPTELGEELSRRYERELKQARVNVIVKSFADQRIFVGGEVGKQGVLGLNGTLTLYQAIQYAGGFLKTANREQVVLMRRGPDGQMRGYAIDLEVVERGENPNGDVQLLPQDVVFVPRSFIADVNVWVEQYVKNNIPVNSLGLGLPVF